MSPRAEELLSAIIAADKELRRLSREITDPFDEVLQRLRTRLRDDVERLMLVDVGLAQRKEVESIMWRRVFYRVIEEHRRRLKKFSDEDMVRRA
ncbi:hypothetical protein THASP1DRAFT_31386, partial [Thamnocephalis sphaerospora]